jgi:hypothetical protein
MSKDDVFLEVKVAALVRSAIKSGNEDGSDIDKVVEETTRQIIEDVLTEIKLGADNAKAESAKKYQKRERKYFSTENLDPDRWRAE